jgi:hypothetical protein
MLWSRIIAASNSEFDQCSDSNGSKRQQSQSAASSLQRRFENISSRQESYQEDPKQLQTFGALYWPPDLLGVLAAESSPSKQFAPEPSWTTNTALFLRQRGNYRARFNCCSRASNDRTPRYKYGRSSRISCATKTTKLNGQLAYRFRTVQPNFLYSFVRLLARLFLGFVGLAPGRGMSLVGLTLKKALMGVFSSSRMWILLPGRGTPSVWSVFDIN